MDDQNKGRLLRIWDVLTLVPISKSVWYAGIRTKRFPAQHKLGRSSFWWEREVLDAVNKEFGNQASHCSGRAP
jgi:predicted DNA-binding transcriptional regulator AlpA